MKVSWRWKAALLVLALIAAAVEGHGSGGDDKDEQPIGRRPPLVIVSMDGFRYDYFARLAKLTETTHKTDQFALLARNGVSAPDGVENVFATKTAPNHYSLVTGLYEESHGVVENFIFDEQLNRSVSVFETDESVARLFHGTPLWVNVVRQSGAALVACFMWVGCSLPIDGVKLVNAVPYRSNATCIEQQAWIGRQLENGVHLLLMYMPEPDGVGHQYGPDSEETNQMLLILNDCLTGFLSVIPDNVNFLLVSDHGMMRFDRNVTIDVRDELFTVRGKDYTEWLVEPKEGRLQDTLNYFGQISGVRAYAKSAIPERWHYGHNIHISHVLVVADAGVRLVPPGAELIAGHGYDNSVKEMRPGFFGRGPDLGHVQLAWQEWRVVDVYLLAVVLLGLDPSPNNGSCAHVVRLLNKASLHLAAKHCSSSLRGRFATSSLTALISVSVVVFIACVFSLHLFSQRRGERRLRAQLGLGSSASVAAHRQPFFSLGRQQKKDSAAPLLTTAVSDDEEEDDLFSRKFIRGRENGAMLIGDNDL